MPSSIVRPAAATVAICLGLSGCAARLEVRALATGRPDVAAYELAGADIVALRRQAQRLCPAGGVIQRQSSAEQAPEQVDGLWRGWLNQATNWTDPPDRAAQLVVVCREMPGQGAVPAASTPAAGASAGGAEVAAVLPIGPLNVEW